MTDPEKVRSAAEHPPKDARGAGADQETDEIQEIAECEDPSAPAASGTGAVARPATLPGSKMPRPAG